jgi:hypothetical protein
MQRTFNFTGHYEDRGAPRKIVHSQKVTVKDDTEINLAANALLAQISEMGMIEKVGETWRLIPIHRFSEIECTVSSLILEPGLILA